MARLPCTERLQRLPATRDALRETIQFLTTRRLLLWRRQQGLGRENSAAASFRAPVRNSSATICQQDDDWRPRWPDTQRAEPAAPPPFRAVAHCSHRATTASIYKPVLASRVWHATKIESGSKLRFRWRKTESARRQGVCEAALPRMGGGAKHSFAGGNCGRQLGPLHQAAAALRLTSWRRSSCPPTAWPQSARTPPGTQTA